MAAKSKRVPKYLYGWKLYVNYGQGWEYECFEGTREGYRENRKAYRENCTYPQKWTRGRADMATNKKRATKTKVVDHGEARGETVGRDNKGGDE